MYLNEVKVLRKSFKKNNVISDKCGVHVSVQISFHLITVVEVTASYNPNTIYDK